ncbi:MAG: hypothetical protein LBE16_02120 [Clostridiales Family XIII bacterium]|jgi:hypothetical protein|nr:hypothetical protein [Clostridiales Family XIII bacterium]
MEINEKTNANIRIELYHDGQLVAALGNYMSDLPRRESEKVLFAPPIAAIDKCNKTFVRGIIDSRETGVPMFTAEAPIENPADIRSAIGNMTVRVNVEAERLKMQRSIRPIFNFGSVQN